MRTTPRGRLTAILLLALFAASLLAAAPGACPEGCDDPAGCSVCLDCFCCPNGSSPTAGAFVFAVSPVPAGLAVPGGGSSEREGWTDEILHVPRPRPS